MSSQLEHGLRTSQDQVKPNIVGIYSELGVPGFG